MSKEFEPYNKIESRKSEFSVWEYKNPDVEEPPEISAQELFENECELLKQEAINQGYSEGMRKAQAEIEEKIALFSMWIELIKKPVQLLDEQLTQEIIRTIIWLCEHCIGVELSVIPERLHALLNEIKEELPSLNSNKILAMHPHDIEWIITAIDKKEISGLHDVLVADSSLNRGDFYLKGDHSELDGRVQTRLNTLFAKYINKDNFMTPIKVQDKNEHL